MHGQNKARHFYCNIGPEGQILTFNKSPQVYWNQESYANLYYLEGWLYPADRQLELRLERSQPWEKRLLNLNRIGVREKCRGEGNKGDMCRETHKFNSAELVAHDFVVFLCKRVGGKGEEGRDGSWFSSQSASSCVPGKQNSWLFHVSL